MSNKIDFSLAHKLGGKALRAAFYEAFQCPFCGLPVYIHHTFGSTQVRDLFLPLCDCEQPGNLFIEIPTEENVPLEREAIVRLVAATRQLLAMQQAALMAPEGDTADAGDHGLAEGSQELADGVLGDGDAGAVPGSGG